MKVKELIEELEKCNPDSNVFIEAHHVGESFIVEVINQNPFLSAVDVVIVG